MWRRKKMVKATPPAAEPIRDPNAALKARIARAHRRLKEARADHERDEVVAALTKELDRSLDELHLRLTTNDLEKLYRFKE